MTLEARLTYQAQHWFPNMQEQGEPADRLDPVEARLPDEVGDDRRMPVAATPQFIPRVFPGL